ncbi:MerR family transcriptional regulator [Phormidesmis priestleyi]
MQAISLKAGDLAKQTRVSVRPLHYYDEIGLLSPSHRTEAGYRVYGEDDIIRLQQIVIVEFSSLDQARAWYASPTHAEALKLREQALDRQLTFVEGIVPPV